MYQNEKDEQARVRIFDLFSLLQSEAATDRQKCFLQLYDQILKWCKTHLYKNADEMTMEIYNITRRIIKKEAKHFKNKDDFFKYLTKSLKRGKIEYYRKFKWGGIKIPKDKIAKVIKMNEYIKMEESQLGRNLSYDERRNYLTEWFNDLEYLDLFNKFYVDSITHKNHDGKEINKLNKTTSFSDAPHDDLLQVFTADRVCEAVKAVLNKRQERKRPCDKALFTLHCIENVKDLEVLYPVLDKSILESCQKNRKTLTQYEIYQKYHPNAKKTSAGSMSTTNLEQFLNDLKMYLKEIKS